MAAGCPPLPRRLRTLLKRRLRRLRELVVVGGVVGGVVELLDTLPLERLHAPLARAVARREHVVHRRELAPVKLAEHREHLGGVSSGAEDDERAQRRSSGGVTPTPASIHHAHAPHPRQQSAAAQPPH